MIAQAERRLTSTNTFRFVGLATIFLVYMHDDSIPDAGVLAGLGANGRNGSEQTEVAVRSFG
jgi:hypothetical protein